MSKKFMIPYGSTEIRDFAYRNRIDIINVSIPDSVQVIGLCAFNGCTNLKKFLFQVV